MSDRLQSVISELKQINANLKREITELRSKRTGSYRLRMADVSDLGKAYIEIESGEQRHGLKILEDVLENLDPRWRSM
jgi:hypothetical protein